MAVVLHDAPVPGGPCPSGRKLRQESPAELREAAAGQNRSRRPPVGRLRLKSGNPRQPSIALRSANTGAFCAASGALPFATVSP